MNAIEGAAHRRNVVAGLRAKIQEREQQGRAVVGEVGSLPPGFVLVRVKDLVGKSGIVIDERNRKRDGSLAYPHTAEYGPCLVRVSSVRIGDRDAEGRQDGRKWLHIRWSEVLKAPADWSGHRCGYAGQADPKKWGNWFVAVKVD